MLSNNENHWYLIYTRPRYEKKIRKNLDREDIENFLPTYSSLRQWKDRKKRVDMLYFPRYVFVKTAEHRLWEALSVNGVIKLIKQGDKPAIVPDSDIIALNKLQSIPGEPEVINHQQNDWMPGQKVKIINGPLIHHIGTVIKSQGKYKLQLRLEAINKSVLIELSHNDIEIMPDEIIRQAANY